MVMMTMKTKHIDALARYHQPTSLVMSTSTWMLTTRTMYPNHSVLQVLLQDGKTLKMGILLHVCVIERAHQVKPTNCVRHQTAVPLHQQKASHDV